MRTICGSRVRLDNIFMNSQMQMYIYTFAENLTLWPSRLLFLDMVFFNGSVMGFGPPCGKHARSPAPFVGGRGKERRVRAKTLKSPHCCCVPPKQKPPPCYFRAGDQRLETCSALPSP